MSDLSRGTYTGQFGFVYIEPKNNPGQYDQELFLPRMSGKPYFTTAEDEEEDDPGAKPPEPKKDEKPNGGRSVISASPSMGSAWVMATGARQRRTARVVPLPECQRHREHSACAPGHQFQVVALDGNAVPHPQLVDVLELGTAERIDAVVEMKKPGVWILGTPKDDDRKNGMGVVVEYANKGGAPRWIKPAKKVGITRCSEKAARSRNPTRPSPW